VTPSSIRFWVAYLPSYGLRTPQTRKLLQAEIGLGTVRDHYYNYLTATTQTGEDDSLSKMLAGLGYQMYLCGLVSA
jgi:hypothetical protein